MKPTTTKCLLASALSAAVATVAFAQTKTQDSTARLDQVDALLNRLEKRLLDDESDGLIFGEKMPPPPDSEDKPSATFKFDKTKIDAKTREQEQLRGISDLVADLENQVDQLSANVQKTKQGIVDEAGIDNFVAIEAALAASDTAAITALSIKLDGHLVYELKEASGLWMPSKAFPLYAGPLQPGNHRLDVEARVAMKIGQALPMNGDVYRFVNKSFEFVVPGGTANRRWVVTITPPAKADGTADAALKEAI